MAENSQTVNDKGQLDRFDIAIIKTLRVDGRISVTALADQVGLTKTPCQVRLKRLQETGYITGFRAVVNPQKLGLNNVVFIEVKLSDTTERALSAFDQAVRATPEIEMCHMIAGAFDYLIKVRTSDIHAYRRVLGEKISALPYVSNTSTHVSMQSVVDEAF